MGAVVATIAFGYALVWFFLVWGVYRFTLRKQKSKKIARIYSFAVFLVLYLIPFWDLIPSLVLHQYYCKTQAGLNIYKTPKQWEEENSMLIENFNIHHLPEAYKISPPSSKQATDTYYHLPSGVLLEATYDLSGNLRRVYLERSNGDKGYWLNERFIQINKNEKIHSNWIRRKESTLEDFVTGDVIARVVDFGRGRRNVTKGSFEELRQQFVLEWGNRQCDVGDNKSDTFLNKFNIFTSQFM